MTYFNDKKIKILVSGCGGDIGQSIGKILQENNENFILYGLDINDKNPSKFIFQNFSIGLPANHKDFFEFLFDYINKYKIDLFLPIAEPELRYFSKKGITGNIGDAKIIGANQEAWRIGFNKFETAEFLKMSGLPFPKTIKFENFKDQLSFPLIVKPNIGSGSKKLFIAKDNFDLEYLNKKLQQQDYIVQEYLSEEKGEFTCGLFKSKDCKPRSIIFKRELSRGYSNFGELVYNEKISSLLYKLAYRLNLTGSINVQLRMNNDEPVIFEINPRFSSTVLFRHLFGFKDVFWSIQDALDLPKDDYILRNDLRYFYKGFSEYVG